MTTISSYILVAISHRKKAYSKLTRTRADSTWNEYKLLKNKLRTLKINSKRAFASAKLNPELPPNVFWKNRYSLGIGK